ncbi:hypothetical protein NFJ02_11g05210 [Pycnococcus provasolii]
MLKSSSSSIQHYCIRTSDKKKLPPTNGGCQHCGGGFALSKYGKPRRQSVKTNDSVGLCMCCTNIVVCGLCKAYDDNHSSLPPIAYMLKTREKVRVGKFNPTYGQLFCALQKDGVVVTA